MVDIKKILKKLEDFETPEEKIEYLKSILEELTPEEDEDDIKEIIKIIKDLIPHEDDENLEDIISSPKDQFSKPTSPINPVVEIPQNLETIVPREPFKTENKEDDMKYNTSNEFYANSLKDAYTPGKKDYSTNRDEDNPTGDYRVIQEDQITRVLDDINHPSGSQDQRFKKEKK